jgi:hypothetical protein
VEPVCPVKGTVVEPVLAVACTVKVVEVAPDS